MEHAAPQLEHPVRLGPFELQGVLGRGGMGVAWRGVHVEQGEPVAIKVVRHKHSGSDTYLAEFEEEVRRVAQFTHPGIVTTFDFGAVPEAAAEAVREQLGDDGEHPKYRIEAGSPFVAMEYCNGGSLRERGGSLGWPGICGVLLALLDALAHAHARGVVHRDIKPDNVLFDHRDGRGPAVKLTDFGIALVPDLERMSTTFRVAGTLPYMAPEQFRDWREQGPWTDLYAIGCVAYTLVAGRPPFAGETPFEYADHHVNTPPPPLPPRPGIPASFGEWILRLLQKGPWDRFPCAADAAHVLATLAPPEGDALRAYLTEGSTLSVLDTAERVTRPRPAETAIRTTTPAPAGPETAGGPIDLARAPVPETWRHRMPAPPSMSLIGSGLGLYAWRTIPLVGREAERDRLWAALREVDEQRRPRAVLLRGEAGVGKSRLAEWMAQRALEVGAVGAVLRTEHNPIAGRRDGLAHALAVHLRVPGLDDEGLRKRVRRFLAQHGEASPYQQHALAELLTGGSQGSPFFRTPRQRHVLIARVLALMGRVRPVILLLEDVQWGAEALAFTRHLVAERDEGAPPVLVVLTARDEALAGRPQEAALAGDLLDADAAEALALGPLSEGEHDELVRTLLRLEGDLAEQVRQRTAGNPLFAAQLVGDWVGRGVLRVGRTGFELAPGEDARIPEQIHALWQGRVERALDGEVQAARTALQVAAALGIEVDTAEWKRACAELQIEIPRQTLVRLLQAHLLEPRDRGWAFRHGMLRESIELDAETGGSWSEVNLACVAMLRRRADARGTPERIGRHLVAAGRLEEGFEPLLMGARQRLETSDYGGAGELLQHSRRILEQLDVSDRDERHGHEALARLRVLIGRGDYAEADRLAARTAEQARRQRWTATYPRALRYQAMTLQKQGGLGLAETVLFRAQMEAVRAGDRGEEARCQLHLSTVARMLGEPDRAREAAQAGLALFEDLGDRHGMADSLAAVGNADLAAGLADDAESRLRDALGIFEELGNQFGVASCRNSLAEIQRGRGELDAAEREYRHAQIQCERMGSPERIVPLLNRGLIQLELGHFDQARALLTMGLQIARQQERVFLGYFHTALLPCAAHAGDWSRWDDHAERAARYVAESGAVDRDLARPAQQAGDLARAAGEEDRARSAYRLARDQWDALGDEEARASVEASLAGDR